MGTRLEGKMGEEKWKGFTWSKWLSGESRRRIGGEVGGDGDDGRY